ncbi:tautomerase family protein [Amycolatopsis benzoatilytica]|uniref:tautomerase family protein n=1 Tax=Amycolatopsis benzoatilytica TaxID=346045 RepID=UPI000364FC8E|nr:tautomerase family protein [Amycolatopsis benzoatilytica]
MPIIEVTLAEGRTPAQLRELIHQLTESASRALDTPIAAVRVVLRETSLTHFAAGDVTLEERRLQSSAPPAGQ